MTVGLVDVDGLLDLRLGLDFFRDDLATLDRPLGREEGVEDRPLAGVLRASDIFTPFRRTLVSIDREDSILDSTRG